MAYYCLHNFNMMPWEYASLRIDQKGVLKGLVDVYIEKNRNNPPIGHKMV